MKAKRFLSGLLAFLMAAGTLAFPAFAAEAPTTSSTTETDPGLVPGSKIFEEFPNYTGITFKSVEEKLTTMKKMVWNDRYELYAEPWTGEVICLDTVTGQTLCTNPYDASTTGTTDTIKYQLLSQIIIKFSDTTGSTKEYSSYEQAALNEQISMKLIKGGLRVEYTIGRSESSYLVPRRISVERFDQLIAANLPGGAEWVASGESIGERDESLLTFKSKRVVYRYIVYDPNDPTNPEKVLMDMYTKIPVTKKKGIAVMELAADIKPKELLEVESIIKEFCPDYTFEELERDHAETEYTGTNVEPALFKLSIEYKLTDQGMKAELPGNGIRYDSANYTLEELQFLPYLGAGSSENTGYTFTPDGSGAITRFEDFVGKNANRKYSFYGVDYAYLSAMPENCQTPTLPVYGIVQNVVKTSQKPVTTIEIKENADGEKEEVTVTSYETVRTTTSSGFVAIVEEGDALTTIMSKSGGTTHKFFHITTLFQPRPKDQYNLADSISVGSSSMITVVSDRKYVGRLSINYIMLNDSRLAQENGLENYYEPTWVGMAKAYRDYLEGNGTLTRLTENDVEEKLPLYIETFGVVPTTKKILSIPVDVDVALTSFEDIRTMYDELAAEGISNINFKLTGYANGDMFGTLAPYKLKWQKAAGGADGFRDLVAYANEKGFGLYPDFEFTAVSDFESFDGFSLKKHAVKTINDQYVYKFILDPVSDGSVWGVGLLVSPSCYSYFYENFSPRYQEYGLDSIAMTTFGTDLSSDFDTDEPYNREDTKLIVTQFLEQVKKDYSSLLGDGGNAYTLKYFDHLLNVSLDSSRFAVTSNSVPFLGLVLHGYINFAGTPLNMEGDIDYALLKAIENGSSIYYILNYDNTELLKESPWLSRYYAVRYDITKDDLIEQYNKLNDAIGDLQTTLISGHEFVRGERIPEEYEMEADRLEAEKQAEIVYEKQKLNQYKAAVNEYRKKYEAGEIGAGETIVWQEPEKQAVTLVSGGLQKDENGAVKIDSKTGEPVYTTTKYTSDDGSIVKVTYGDSVSFILNYNDFTVKVWDDDGTEYTIDGYSFVKID
ncbi:MAG: DUF5696 domain-containing protein [Eubacteriales bacterium]|nr:DUF5696 domain-containing protein [Eubacteriales bacterium]